MNTLITGDIIAVSETIIPLTTGNAIVQERETLIPETEIPGKRNYSVADAWSINNRKRFVRVYPRRA
ncbi:MAG: hypothetical protein IPH18_02040 [Chitinophagaceae bacterium]|nr:hypothetical protein [Chitinophagaceae bacterium]MBK8951673.1 hypothetical protein [Chitinophagaceae bacterium]